MIDGNPFSVLRFAEAFPEMIEEIMTLERHAGLSLVAGLQLLPEFAPNAVRIEALTQLMLQFAQGSRKPSSADLDRHLNHWMGQTLLPSLEDPVEDVFISNIISEIGNTRVFEGIWESNDFTTQLVLQSNYLTAMEARNRALALWPFPMMVLSEALAERANLNRFTCPAGVAKSRLKIPDDIMLTQFSQYCQFSWDDLNKLKIRRADIESYFITPADLAGDLDNGFDTSAIHDHPLLETEEGILVLVPSSLMKALRVSILRKVHQFDLSAAFHGHLLEQQAGAVSESFERMAAPAIDFEDQELKPPQLESCTLQASWFRFDRAWYALAVIISVPEHALSEATASEVLTVTEKDEETLIAWEKAAKEFVSRIPGFRGGLIFHVASSLGGGLLMAGPACNGNDGWRDWNLSLADLRVLSRSEDMDLTRLVIIATIRDEFEKRDVRWQSGNGDFNFIAWALSVEFRLIPRDWAANQVNVVIPSDAMFDLRSRTRTRIDEHGVLFLHKLDDPSGAKLIPATVAVERYQPWSFFDDSRQPSAYFCQLDPREGRLRAAVEYGKCVLWIEMKRPSHQESRSGIFHLWQALVTWFERLFESVCRELLENRLPPLISLRFVVEEPFVFDDGTAKAGKVIDVIGRNSHSIVFGVSKQILRQFQSETNLAEKQLISAVFESLLSFCGRVGQKAALDRLIDEAFRGGAVRSMHVAFRTDVRAMLHALVRRDRPARASHEIKETSRIGLAHRICPFIATGTYRGSAAQWLLNSAATRIRASIKQRLITINRQSLILRVFENIEAIEADNWRWKLSASALLGMHGGIETVDPAMREHVSANEGALLASKIAIEMAVCDSPVEDGVVATDLDLRWLIGEVLLLIEFGYQSDALFTGLAQKDHVSIHSNGDIEADSSYWNEVVVPFRQSIFRRGLEGAAESYAGMIGVKATTEPMPDRDAFLAAFRDEVGVSLESAFKIVQGLGLIALGAESLLVDSTQCELLTKLESLSGVSAPEINAFIDYFSLDSRPDYNAPTPGFVGHDIHPWRFSRRLSLVRRPLLRWTEGDTKRVMVSPAVAEHSLGHFMVKFYQGEYEPKFFISDSAKAWVGKAAEREGDEFEDQVAAELGKADFIVTQRVFMSQLGAPKALGEIDVIAFDSKNAVVWVIECKNLREARTIKEIAEQLGKCTGRDDVRGDIVYKHLRRMEWLKGNIGALTKLLKLNGIVTLKDRIVSSRIVPMRFRERSIYPSNHWIAYNELDALSESVLD
jgi:hypothetical protein